MARECSKNAAFGDGHSFVGLEEDSDDEASDGGVVGEAPDGVGAAFDLAVDALEGVRGPDRAPVGLRERREGEEVFAGVIEHGGAMSVTGR